MEQRKSKKDYLSLLTGREKEILVYIIQGNSRIQIAKKLFLSFHTVNTHMKHIFYKMEVHTVPELILKTLSIGIKLNSQGNEKGIREYSRVKKMQSLQ